MQTRRSLRLVVGALVLVLPLLGSCGFGKATDRPYTQAAGINNHDGDVAVLSAVIVAAQPGSGTFVASLSNSSPTKDFQLTGMAGVGDWTDLKVTPSDLSIDIVARGFVNLVNEDPITITGDFDAGQVAQLTLTFDSGDTVTMDVPIVYACNSYAGLDPSEQGPAASESASPTDVPSPGDVPTAGTTVSPTESPSESSSSSPSESPSGSASSTASGAQEPYDCVAVGEG
jgi:hypothetical protein